METYHKIQTLFKRHLDGPNKGKMIRGAWTTPELEYLAGNQWEFTEKVDGTNIRIGWGYPAGCREKVVQFAGRTDRAEIPEPLLRFLRDNFTTDIFETAFPDAAPNDIVLFGEGYGPKIQSGGKYTGGEDVHSFVLFDVNIGHWWLSRKDVDDIAKKLGIDSVPTIGTGTLQDAIDIVESGLTWDKNGKMTNWGGSIDGKRQFAGLKSQWGNFEAEGIVARPVVPMFSRNGERIITKIKTVDFK